MYFCKLSYRTIMDFETVLSNPYTKKYLNETIISNRIAHAQLFIGEEGVGTLPMAIAYATEILTRKGDANTKIKCEHLSHPDLHFAYPTATSDKIKDHPTSSSFSEEWRSFISENPYRSLYEWYQFIGIANKQGKIGVDDAKEITAKLSLKSFEGGYKIMIIWMAERMNDECSNKLLKLLEEPPAETIFILVVENENLLLNTILSRCQITRFTKLGEEVIAKSLIKNGLAEPEAQRIAIRSQGNYNKALSLLKREEDSRFEEWFAKTKLYQIYVADYLETKSIDRSRKKKIIIYIYILMGVSIYFAPIIFVKIGLALLTVFITYYLFKVIPDK